MESPRKLLLAAALLAMGACELGPAQALPAGQGAQAQNSSRGATLDSTSLELHPSQDGAEVTAMTQNLYVGADLAPILEALVSNPRAVPALVSEALASIRATDFPQRAAAIAREIDSERPQLVALQEASRICEVPGSCEDHLEMLLSALSSSEPTYRVVAIYSAPTVTLPSSTGGLARLTDRNAILARSDVAVSLPEARAYHTNVTIQVAGDGAVTVERGWVSVEAKLRTRTVRFVNTHLEVGDNPLLGAIQVAQGAELIAALEEEARPVILTGDFNSAADLSTTPTYGLFVVAGYVDGWPRSLPPASGLTCCQAPDLLNPVSTLSQRIDIIFSRDPLSLRQATTVRAERVGASQSDRTTPSHLWPSDHAGVVEALRFRPSILVRR